MTVYSSLDDLVDYHSVQTAIYFNPETFRAATMAGGTLKEPEKWGPNFLQWLNAKSPLEKRIYPIRVHMPALYFYWPVMSDGAAFARSFGRILRPYDSARRLAAAALFAMNKRFGWGWDPRADDIRDDTFVGVHLRTELDSRPRFPPYTEQVRMRVH